MQIRCERRFSIIAVALILSLPASGAYGAVQGDAEADLELIEGAGVGHCEAYFANLKNIVGRYDLVEERPILPDTPGLSSPEWKELDLYSDSAAEDVHRVLDYLMEPWELFSERREKGIYRIRVAYLDVDGDKIKDTVYGRSIWSASKRTRWTGPRNDTPPGAQDAETQYPGWRGGWLWSNIFIVTPNPESQSTLGLKRWDRYDTGVFVYGDRVYVDVWAPNPYYRERAELHVMTANGIFPVCKVAIENLRSHQIEE